jgi:potassium efflux system protein
MSIFKRFFWGILMVWIPLAGMAKSETTSSDSLNLVSEEVLKVKLKEGVSAGNDELNPVLDLYRSALSNLEAMKDAMSRREVFLATVEAAPLEAKGLLGKVMPPMDDQTRALFQQQCGAYPLEKLESVLAQIQTTVAAAQSFVDDLHRELVYQEKRPAAMEALKREWEAELAQVVAQDDTEPSGEEVLPSDRQAQRWVNETRYAALNAKLKLLDAERMSHPMRVILMQAKVKYETADLELKQVRFEILQQEMSRRREDLAQQVRLETDQAKSKAAGQEPVLVEYAENNALLSAELSSWSHALATLDREQSMIEKMQLRIVTDHQETEEVLRNHGLSAGLGRLLLMHRQSLVSISEHKRRAQKRGEMITRGGVNRHRYRNELRSLVDLDAALEQVLVSANVASVTVDEQQLLRELLVQRDQLLNQVLEVGNIYLDKLIRLDNAEKQLIESSEAYRILLDKNLIWLRSENIVNWRQFRNLPHDLMGLFSFARWKTIGSQALSGVAAVPWTGGILLLSALLIGLRKVLKKRFVTLAKGIGHPLKDRFLLTARALVLTTLLAGAIPLGVAAVGWMLIYSPDADPFVQTMGHSFMEIASYLSVVQFIRYACAKNGLAGAHFGWEHRCIGSLYRACTQLIYVYVPSHVFFRLLQDYFPEEPGRLSLRLVFVGYNFFFSVWLFRLFHPRKGILQAQLQLNRGSFWGHSYLLMYFFAVAFPLALCVGMLLGYNYSVQMLSLNYRLSLFVGTTMIFVYGLAARWLQLTAQRLTYDAALQRREELRAEKAAEAGAEADASLHVDEPEVDLVSLNDETLGLLRMFTYSGMLIGLYFIWRTIFPAFHFLDEVELWNRTVIENGAPLVIPITLGSLGKAILCVVITVILGKRLPSLVEMVLLRRSNLPDGVRYTVTTLSTYVLITAGLLSAFKMIGANWGQLQWLVAALGVGIGFGLQEIVANFISGLIILFERPIRVGDLVTVAGVDGIVTKIRIRATTIRTWERKELLVPNKDFVTKHLLNWSLSDQVNRITVDVGIAYGSDVEKALTLIQQAAVEHKLVLDDPAPMITFEGFGGNALQLILRAYLGSLDQRLRTTTDLHKSINEKFNEAGIVIAFPQRDLHLNTENPLRIQVEPLT